jgi:eukaryotic-like serine/threonine-protein kinase
MELPVSIGAIVANKYRIDRVIGQGGMGVVVAAFHLELEQPVAIKFLTPAAGSREDAGERFRREARAAARIHSDHVARVLDIEVLDGRIPYMVMELLDGHDLEKELELTGSLPVEVAVDYILQAIDAVAEAHAAGIVHRDLKPTNLFLAKRTGGQRIIKVLDFGISKISGPGWGSDAALTRSASIFGSPLYMSPEQMRSARDVDARSDIWSLGAMLFELVAGRPPYVADSIPALCMAIINAPPPLLREVLPTAPVALEAILSRCLSRDPNDRFASVAELAQALVPLAPHAVIHSERARRLLSDQSASLGLAATGLSSPPPAVGASGSAPAGEAPRTLSLTANPTQSSWGKTGGRALVTRRTGTILGVAVGLAAAALLASQLFRSDPPSGGAQTAVHAASPVPSASPLPPPEVPAVPPPAAAEQLAAPPEAPAASAASLPKPPNGVAPRPRPVSGAPSPPPARPARPANSSSGLTDFGGRLY